MVEVVASGAAVFMTHNNSNAKPDKSQAQLKSHKSDPNTKLCPEINCDPEASYLPLLGLNIREASRGQSNIKTGFTCLTKCW